MASASLSPGIGPASGLCGAGSASGVSSCSWSVAGKLRRQGRLPRFRQRILRDGICFEDDVSLCSPTHLLHVALPLSASEGEIAMF